MITEAINNVVEGNDLSTGDAESAMTQIMEGKATDAQIGSFLTALRLKGETIDEISAFASIMRDKASAIKPKVEPLLDTCGTGGDKSSTFNISTTVAFVLAAGGVGVAKHGNRSVSSCCGSADVLEALGVKIDQTPEQVEKCIEDIGIGFMFAPGFHKAMKYAIGPRKEIAIRTVFNILGPLTNPAGAGYQLLGVYDPKLCTSLSRVLKKLGSKAAMVVHGEGLDEVATTGRTMISELKADGTVEDYEITPEGFGFKTSLLDELTSESVEENSRITKDILSGSEGPKTDIVILNSACALKVSQKVSSIEEGVEMARDIIKSGKALDKLGELVKHTNA